MAQQLINGFNPKLLKKTKQEIMRRYHPDKHSQTPHMEELTDEFIGEINEICRVANKIHEMLTEK